MTGFNSKREMAADKQEPAQEPVECLDCGSHNVGLPANYDSLVDSVKTQPAHSEWNAALDEAAARIGEIKGFGQATQDSFAVFIQGLKK